MKTALTAIAGVIALAFLFHGTNSAPLNRDPIGPKEKGKALNTLMKFGYINKADIPGGGGSKLDSPVVVKAIKNVQRFGGLSVTGNLNDETLKLLNTDRCGESDPIGKLDAAANAGNLTAGRYYLQGTVWRKKHLTYRFISLTPDLSGEKQKNIIRTMLQKWDDASSLTITEQTDPAVPDDDVDILIRFVRRYHGDPYAFDGPGGTLAHAYYPHNNKGLSGDAHFDDDERFTTGTKDGINLDWVAVHEFGHSLGLEHSNVRESIMYPWYKGYFPNIELTYDDIQGIQALYGPPPTNPTDPPTDPPTTDPPTNPPTNPPTDPPTTDPPTNPPTNPPTDAPTVHPACRPKTTYDAVVLEEDTNRNQFTHFFHGDSFWTLSRQLERSETKKVGDYFPEVRTPISAAYRNKRGYLVIFSGSRFWEYDNPTLSQLKNKRRRLLRSGSITQYGLSSSLANMDAMFTWERNKKTYIFKGAQYWRYNENNLRIDGGYPKSISIGWPDLPSNIDAAVKWSNTYSYVFKGNDYWKLENYSRNRKVYAVGGYPRKVAKVWMKCKNEFVGALGIGALQVGP